ncbi:unnamed protein product [Cunninghamella blakesleeana]
MVKFTDGTYSPFCKFIFKQCTKQIRLSSFRPASFEKCLYYLLNGLEDKEMSDLIKVDTLRALSSLLYENSSYTSKYYPKLIPLLLTLSDRSVKPLEIRRMAINCLGNLCIGAGTKLQPHYKSIYEALLSNICVVNHTSKGNIMVVSSSLDFTDPAIRKIASSTLRALQFLLSQDKSLISNPLCDILEIIYTFIFMHVNVQSYHHLTALKDTSSNKSSKPSGLLRSSRLSTTPSFSHQVSWRLAKPINLGVISSDSEISDTDSTSYNPRKLRDDAKIRNNAMLCLLSIAKITPRSLYTHWPKFIPDTFSSFLKNHSISSTNSYVLSSTLQSDQHSFSLITLLLYDPMMAVRITVCHTLIAMLDGSKQYLNVASEREVKSSFTSLSERLASILKDLHLALVYSLLKESQMEVQCLILKVISTLMSNTPYTRLNPGYLVEFYAAITQYWDNHDPFNNNNNSNIKNKNIPEQLEEIDKKQKEVQITLLQTLATMMTSNGRIEEINLILIGENDGEEIKTTLKNKKININNRSIKPLLPILLSLVKNVNNNDTALETQIEAWKVLSHFAKSHRFDTIPDLWEQLAPSFELAINHTESSIRITVLEFAESYSSSMAILFTEEDDINVDQLNKCTSWWMIMLEKYIQKISMDPVGKVRSLACDCLATMAKNVFENLSNRYQKLSIALLLPLPDDGESIVRASACRALGVFVLFPSLREDACFVTDMAMAIIEKMNDDALLIRLRAGWAQGNLCDALVMTSEMDDFDFKDWISLDIWMKFISTATQASLDNDKLRSNAVRAIGSLLRITPRNFLDNRHSIQLVREVISSLAKNIETGSLKTRWNACHAASNLLLNPIFPIGYIEPLSSSSSSLKQQYGWTSTLYNSLIKALTKCNNYKVRINACLALATPKQIHFYGDCMQPIFQAILSTWHNCHDPNRSIEYQELKYHEQLKDQLKDAFKHFYDWVPKEDQDLIEKLRI